MSLKNDVQRTYSWYPRNAGHGGLFGSICEGGEYMLMYIAMDAYILEESARGGHSLRRIMIRRQKRTLTEEGERG